MSQLALGISRLTCAKLIQLGKKVIAALQDNPHVPAPSPELPVLQGLVAAAETASDNYEAEKKILLAKLLRRNTARQALAEALRTEAATVQTATGGDPRKLGTSGFSLRQPARRLGVPAQVQELRVSANDLESLLEARWKAVHGAICYEVESSLEPVNETSWTQNGISTKARAVVKGFASGSRVWLRVRAFGAAGPAAWSEPVARRVP